MTNKITKRNQVEFVETQRFTQWWLWLFLLALGLFPIYLIYKQLIMGIPVGQKPMPDFGVIIFSLFIYAITFLFAAFKLSTEVTDKEIKIRFFPFVTKSFSWEDITSAKIVNYGFVGGWGIRLGSKYGTVYNMKGKMGMAFETKNGKKFCLGTQKESELKKILIKHGFAKH
jgi:hypothetical protein